MSLSRRSALYTENLRKLDRKLLVRIYAHVKKCAEYVNQVRQLHARINRRLRINDRRLDELYESFDSEYEVLAHEILDSTGFQARSAEVAVLAPRIHKLAEWLWKYAEDLSGVYSMKQLAMLRKRGQKFYDRLFEKQKRAAVEMHTIYTTLMPYMYSADGVNYYSEFSTK
jgi:hypothetical protein